MEENRAILNRIIDNIEKVIVGKRGAIELVLMALLCDGHVLIEDLPGVGKTSLVSALAKSIDCSFSRIQFTPDILPSDIVGFSVYNQQTGLFEYREGAVMSNIVLADEINRTSPKTQSSLLEVMAEKQVTVDGKTRRVPEPFLVIATQNPIEYLGTFPLPEAQLDRFFIKIHLGYPEVLDECEILARFQAGQPMSQIGPVATAAQILAMQQQVRQVFVSDNIIGYIVMLVGGTRSHPKVELGASPRSSIALMRAAQSYAYYSGRDFVLPDDVQKMAQAVLSHRMKLSQEAALDQLKPEDIIQQLIETVEVPKSKNDQK